MSKDGGILHTSVHNIAGLIEEAYIPSVKEQRVCNRSGVALVTSPTVCIARSSTALLTEEIQKKTAIGMCTRRSYQNMRRTLLLVCLEHSPTHRVILLSPYKQPAASTDRTSGHNDPKKEVVEGCVLDVRAGVFEDSVLDAEAGVVQDCVLDMKAEVVEDCESSC